MAMSKVPAENSSNGSFRTTGLAGVVIVLAALAAYHNSWHGPFVFDDLPSIPDNPTIRHLWPLGRVLVPPHETTVDGRPVLNLSLAFNYAMSGTRVWSYHALNLLIHMLAGLTLFGIVRRTYGAGRPALRPPEQKAAADHVALAIALLWTVHPLQTEAVTYVIQRGESLMGLFYLLTLYCFIRGVEAQEFCGGPSTGSTHSASSGQAGSPPAGSGHPTPKEVACHERRPKAGVEWFAASVLCCFLGMGTKEVMVSAPVVVFLYDRTFLSGTWREAWRRHWRLYLALAASWVLLAGLIEMCGRLLGDSKGFNTPVPWWAFAATQFPAMARYLWLVLWPHSLAFEYATFWIKHPIQVLPSALLVVGLMWATLWAIRARPALGFLGACFFIILAPTSLTPGVAEMIVEHRMYLPLAAVLALVVSAVHAATKRRPMVFILTIAAAVVACVGGTIQRNKDYRSALALWSDTVAKCPDNERAWNNLAGALAGVPGRLPEAIAAYEQALRVQPNSSGTQNNLGCILANLPGRLPEAIGHFEAAFRLAPSNARARNNLGIFLCKDGRTSEAIVQFEAAVRIKPDYAEAHYNLGVALDQAGRIPETISQFEEAVRIDPDYAEAHYSLGTTLARRGQIPEAIVEFEEAVRIKPDYVEAHRNLGIALSQAGRISEAMAQCQEVLRINPDSADARAFLEKLQKAER